MDPEAPWNVIKGTAVVSVVGAASGATVGVLKRHSPLLFGVSTGVNSAIASFIFFGSREYVFGPVLRDVASSNGDSPLNSPFPRSPSESLAHSALAGAFTGACLHSYRHGPRRAPSGALAFSLVATVLQLAYNQLDIARINYITQQLPTTQHPAATATPDPPAAPSSEPTKSSVPDFSRKIMDAMTWIAPIRRLSDEEYVEIMKKQQEAIDKKLGQVSQELGDGSSRTSADALKNSSDTS